MILGRSPPFPDFKVRDAECNSKTFSSILSPLALTLHHVVNGGLYGGAELFGGVGIVPERGHLLRFPPDRYPQTFRRHGGITLTCLTLVEIEM